MGKRQEEKGLCTCLFCRSLLHLRIEILQLFIAEPMGMSRLADLVERSVHKNRRKQLH
jgi:hypothetical protein